MSNWNMLEVELYHIIRTLLFIFFVVFICAIRKTPRTNNGMPVKIRIKYDIKTIKSYVIVILITVLCVFIGINLLLVKEEWAIKVGVPMIIISGVLFVVAIFNVAAGLLYSCRLKAHGYEVPHNKREYDDNIHNLPFVEGQVEKKGNSVESNILSILFLGVFIIQNIWNIWYIVKWNRYLPTEATVFGGIQIILDLCWIIGAFLFFTQRDAKKYRDDIEQDPYRRVRTSIENGLALCIVGLVVIVVIKFMVVNASEYVLRSREAHVAEYSQINQTSETVIFTGMQMPFAREENQHF